MDTVAHVSDTEIDPYEQLFHRYVGVSKTKREIRTQAEWESFLTSLVNAELIEPSPAKALVLMECTPISFDGFQKAFLYQLSDPSVNPEQNNYKEISQSLEELLEKTMFFKRVTARWKDTLLKKLIESKSENNVQENIGDLQAVLQAFSRQIYANHLKTLCQIQRIQKNMSAILGSQWLQFDMLTTAQEIDVMRTTCGCPWDFQRSHRRAIHNEMIKHKKIAGVRLLPAEENSHVLLSSTFDSSFQKLREIKFIHGVKLTSEERKNDKSEFEEHKENEMIVALSISRSSAREISIRKLEHLISAHRQLALSPYFQRYLGCDTNSADAIHLHYFELAPSSNALELLETWGLFPAFSPLFHFYARELLLGLLDLQEQTTHQILNRISLENIMISHSGTRLFLGKMQFGDPMDPFIFNIDEIKKEREARLLKDYGLLLHQMTNPVSVPLNEDDFLMKYLQGHSVILKYKHGLHDEIGIMKSDIFSIELPTASNIIWKLHSIQPDSFHGCIQLETTSAVLPNIFRFRALQQGRFHLVFSQMFQESPGHDGNIRVPIQIFGQDNVFEKGTTSDRRELIGVVQSIIRYCALGKHVASLSHLRKHPFFSMPPDERQVEEEYELKRNM